MKEIKVYKAAKPVDNTRVSVYNEVKKYNPYHGADGRFASANGMAAGGSFALPKNAKNLKNATIPEGVRVFSGQGAKGKRAVTTSIGTTIEGGKVTGGATKPEATESQKPQSLTEKYALDTSKKVEYPDELFDRITKDVDWSDPNSQSYKDAEYMIKMGGGKYKSSTDMVFDQLGYLDKPTKVSKEEFEELAKQSPYGEIKRGFSSSRGLEQANQYMKDFTDGDITINTRGETTYYGEGSYFAYGRGSDDVAGFYASFSKGGEGPVAKAVLHPDAKIAKAADIEQEAKKYNKGMEKIYSEQKGAKAGLIRDFIGENTRYKTRNTYAALKGYDAIDVGNPEYIVILNRSAVIIQE